MSDSSPSTPEPISRLGSPPLGSGTQAHTHAHTTSSSSPWLPTAQPGIAAAAAPGGGGPTDQALSNRTVPSTVPAPTYDWRSATEAYVGQTKIDRLVHLAIRCPDVRKQCSEAALDLIQRTPNVDLYTQVVQLRLSVAGSAGTQAEAVAEGFVPDDAWVARTTAQNDADLSTLNNALNQYRFTGIKESLRMAHQDLADFYRATGQYRQSQLQYQETREFASTIAQTLEMTLGLAEVALLGLQYDLLSTLVSRAEGIVAGAAESLTKADEAKLDEALAILSVGLHPMGGGYKRSVASTAAGGGGAGGASTGEGTTNALANLYRSGGGNVPMDEDQPGVRRGFNASGAAADGGPSAATTAKRNTTTRHVRLIRDKLNVLGGIALLGQHKFEGALNRFSRVDPNSASHWNYVSTPSDIALYASLCAVVVLSRKEMGRRLLRREGPQSEAAYEAASKAASNAEGGTATGQGITGLLEYNLSARDLLWKYYEGQFAPIRSILGDALNPSSSPLTLDLHLGQGTLFVDMAHVIVEHSVRDLLLSYNLVGIDDMSTALALPSPLVLDQVKALWDSGSVNVRIDMVNRTFCIQAPEDRDPIHQQVLDFSHERTQINKAILLGQAMLENDLILSNF